MNASQHVLTSITRNASKKKIFKEERKEKSSRIFFDGLRALELSYTMAFRNCGRILQATTKKLFAIAF